MNGVTFQFEVSNFDLTGSLLLFLWIRVTFYGSRVIFQRAMLPPPPPLYSVGYGISVTCMLC